MIEQGEAVPRPATTEDSKDEPQYKGGIWAVVSVLPKDLRVKASHARRSATGHT